MTISRLDNDILYVFLPNLEPAVGKVLKEVNEAVTNGPECDVIIDFSQVEIIVSASISNLIILRNYLQEKQRRLLICNIALATKAILTVTGVDVLFEFVQDKQAAIETLREKITS